MNLITVKNLTKYFGATVILDNLNFTLNSQEKTAIIGRNGAGKSTLVKIICGLEDYDQGDIIIASGIKLGYFSQDITLNSSLTVYEELQTLFQKQLVLKAQLQDLEVKISANESIDYDLYSKLLVQYEESGGYTIEYQIETMLNKFGFQEYYRHPVTNLSGGEKTRLALAKLLLSEPDVLILDEPTNNLDIETVEYLESFLKAYKNSVIIISHDRYFINQIVNNVYEIEFHEGFFYKGNYDNYLEEKLTRIQSVKKQFELQQKLIQKEQEFINKNIVRASTTKRAQARRKKLDKLELIEDPRVDNKSIKLQFDFTYNTGNIVLDVKDLAIGYNTPIVEKINFLIKKGERVAILGPNGIGKSTLLKTVNQKLIPLAWKIKYGANVEIAYFDQDLSLLNHRKTVIDDIWDENRTMLEKDIRTLLGSFLFTGEDVYKMVGDLYGGEKVRLALAKLTLKKANFLILDEVTNHLDILSREVLESELINFPGTILFVSHDRFFINKVATRIIEITKNELIEYIGDYNYYLEKRQQKTETVITKNEDSHYQKQKQLKSDKRKLERQLSQLEQEIHDLEQEIEVLNRYLLTEDAYSDYRKATEVHNKLSEKQETLDLKLHEWLEL